MENNYLKIQFDELVKNNLFANSDKTLFLDKSKVFKFCKDGEVYFSLVFNQKVFQNMFIRNLRQKVDTKPMAYFDNVTTKFDAFGVTFSAYEAKAKLSFSELKELLKHF